MKNADKSTHPQLVFFREANDFVTYQTEGGLTKREYFAAMAMQGILSSNDNKGTPPMIAELAVAYADALLAELDKSL